MHSDKRDRAGRRCRGEGVNTYRGLMGNVSFSLLSSLHLIRIVSNDFALALPGMATHSCSNSWTLLVLVQLVHPVQPLVDPSSYRAISRPSCTTPGYA